LSVVSKLKKLTHLKIYNFAHLVLTTKTISLIIIVSIIHIILARCIYGMG